MLQCSVKPEKWGKHPACRRSATDHRKLEAYATETTTHNFRIDEALAVGPAAENVTFPGPEASALVVTHIFVRSRAEMAWVLDV
jgi:hypothetical protein